MRIFTVLAGTLALGACSPMDHSTDGMDAAAYEQEAAAVSDAVASYRTASAAMTSAAQCEAAMEQYRARVQARLEAMAQMAERMDAAMESRGQMMGADAQCGVRVMQMELARHRVEACGSGDMAASQAEAARHCDAMQGFCEHMRMRAGQVGSMMGGGSSATSDGGWSMPDGGMMGWDHAMPGCTYRDGEFQPEAQP